MFEHSSPRWDSLEIDMNHRFNARLVACASLAVASLSVSALAVEPNPANSALGGYTPYTQPRLQDWISVNRQVRDHGGWQNYAMEPYQDSIETDAKPEASDSSAKSDMKDMPMHMHHMQGGKP